MLVMVHNFWGPEEEKVRSLLDGFMILKRYFKPWPTVQ